MHSGRKQPGAARILVKAYPQASQKYEETVCVAAISADGEGMLRLYPIRYRRLPLASRFERYDLISFEMERPKDDWRPESRHVDEDSIQVTEKGSRLSEEAKVRLWMPFVVPSLRELMNENKVAQRSFGIVRPDPGSLRLFARPVAQTGESDQELSASLFHQSALFEDPLKPLLKPEYSFGYNFTSDGHPHEHIVHDWEVQAAYHAYKKLYGGDALAMMMQEYGENIPRRNPHFIMGTMKNHPATFIVIGVLRCGLDPAELAKQGDLGF
jgi:hypothetical protein